MWPVCPRSGPSQPCAPTSTWLHPLIEAVADEMTSSEQLLTVTALRYVDCYIDVHVFVDLFTDLGRQYSARLRSLSFEGVLFRRWNPLCLYMLATLSNLVHFRVDGYDRYWAREARRYNARALDSYTHIADRFASLEELIIVGYDPGHWVCDVLLARCGPSLRRLTIEGTLRHIGPTPLTTMPTPFNPFSPDSMLYGQTNGAHLVGLESVRLIYLRSPYPFLTWLAATPVQDLTLALPHWYGRLEGDLRADCIHEILTSVTRVLADRSSFARLRVFRDRSDEPQRQPYATDSILPGEDIVTAYERIRVASEEVAKRWEEDIKALDEQLEPRGIEVKPANVYTSIEYESRYPPPL